MNDWGAEEKLLAGLLLDEEGAAQIDTVAALVQPEDFADKRLRGVYAEMLELRREGAAITVDSLVANRGEDRDYLVGLCPVASNLAFYAEGIREAAKRRRLIAVTEQVAKLAKAFHGSANELQAAAELAIRRAG